MSKRAPSRIVPSRIVPARIAPILAALVLLGSVASAQEKENETFVDSWANAIAASVAPRWVGPRTPWPEATPRPPSGGALTSTWHPVSVQLGSVAAHAALAEDALTALERAHDWLEARGWPTPPSDAGIGGTPGFDLYLVDDVTQGAPASFDRVVSYPGIDRPGMDRPGMDRPGMDQPGIDRPGMDQPGMDQPGVDQPGVALVQEAFDGPLAWGLLDGGVTHALLDIDVDPQRLEACVMSAYVRASLLAFDPAEAPAWRAATGDYVAWLATGHFGCSDGSIIDQQRESWRTWIGQDSPGGGGALFLAMLSARTDGLRGDFIRDLWSGAPQLTWEAGKDLRAAPDMWQVVNTVMAVGDDPLERLLEEMAVARFFTGERAVGAPLAFLRTLPAEASVPVEGRTAWSKLPRRFEPDGLELEPYGSAYLVVDTREAQAGSTLRIWLRGEYGVGWALNAVRVSESGAEQGRIRAPVRPRTPRSFIPLELVYGETAKVVIVVTNLGARLVDADTPDDQVRSFSLILDKIEP